jgi:hypothetical protein
VNIIKCFYEPIIINSKIDEFSKDSLELIKLWKKSWSDNGWTPIVLGLEDSKNNPLYNKIDLKNYTSNLYKNSINDSKYLELCYSRWFAYGCDDGVWSDYDVMNYGFTPDDMESIKDGDPYFIDRVGSCGFASKKGYDHIINGFIDVYNSEEITNSIFNHQLSKKQRTDISDMIINILLGKDIRFSDKGSSIFTSIYNGKFLNKDWKKYPLVHYHNGLWNSFDKSKYKTRSNFIKKERPIL